MASQAIDLVVDATPLSDDSAYRGIGTYVRHLLAGLAHRSEFNLTALCQPRTPLPASVNRLSVHRRAPDRWRRREHELLLPFDLLRSRGAVFHSPALDPPWRSRSPWVQTLHDVIPLLFDDPDLEWERKRWERQASRYRRAAAVVAVSRHTADTGISMLGLDARRIEVIPHGVAAQFRPPAVDERTDPGRLLLVSEYSKRKGYDEAFAVVGELAQLGYRNELYVVGRIAPWVRPAVQEHVSRAAAPDRIRLLGFVDDLVAQYQRAKVLIMSSRYEGFGFPVLEAMACGTPVVAFANSSLTEVVGDAGLLVPDGDVVAMTQAVRSLLDDSARWNEFSTRGLEHVKRFSWERSVAAHAEVFSALS